jgi:hypothetical protein
MFQKIKTQFTQAWHWTLAHLPFGRKGAENPVVGFMDEAEQRYQAFQQKRRMRRLKRRAMQGWSRFQQQVGGIFTPVRTWLKAHQRALTLVAVGVGVVLLGLVGLVLWRRSPAFRAALLTAFGAAAAIIAAARTVKPAAVPTPTPNLAVEAAERVLETA